MDSSEKTFNLLFKGADGSQIVIVEKGATKIGEIIKKYFSKILKSNLSINNVINIFFFL